MIYQVDYIATSSGRVVSMTKRRIRWRWGVANKKALDGGKFGAECRGFEHEVNLVWSIASGKRLITDDGNEVHFNPGGRPEGKFQHSWVGTNNQVFTIVANASPSLKSRPNIRQFELFIDGKSFDSFPRIFELSKDLLFKRVSNSRLSRSSVSNSAFYLENRSDAETSRKNLTGQPQWAQRTTRFKSERILNENTVHQPKKEVEPIVQPVDLLSASIESPQDVQFSSIPSLGLDSLWDSNYSGKCNPNKPPSYDAVWNSIMDAYDAVDSKTFTQEKSQTNLPNMDSLQIDTSYQNVESCDKNLSVESPKDVTDFDDMLNSLVNLDDLSSPVYKGYTQETFEKNKKKTMHSLAELKNMHSQSNSGPTKEIMKTHQTHAVNHSGQMVAYGQPQHSYSYNAYTYNASPIYGSSH